MGLTRGVADQEYPQLLHTVLDTAEPRRLAEFYRALMGLEDRPGDEPPAEGPDTADWLVLLDGAGRRVLAVQEEPEHRPTTWPDHRVPMQLHTDWTVPDRDALERHRARAEELGARLLLDRTDDEEEPLHVLADPAGHPFCLFVA